jgi:hypothetical protein
MGGMTTNLPSDVEKQILQRLEDSDDINDIILDVCESQGLDWKEAQAIVDSLRAQHADEITLGQSPALVMISLALFLGGFGLAAYTVVNLVATFEAFRSVNHGANANVANTLGFFISYILSNAQQLFWGFIFSAAMIVGSLRGMSEVWSAVFSKFGWFQPD